MRLVAKCFLIWLVSPDIGIGQTVVRGATSDYCAFEVKVTAPSGSPLEKVPVAMIRGRKETIFETSTDAGGVARICDAPLEPIDLVVGKDICGSVMVRLLRYQWPDTEQVLVTFAEKPCDHFGLAAERQVLFRAMDE